MAANGQTDECRETKKIEHRTQKNVKRKNLHIIKSLVSANNGEENEESRYVNHIEE